MAFLLIFRPCWRMKNDTASPPSGSRNFHPPMEDPRILLSATRDVSASARWCTALALSTGECSSAATLVVMR